MVLISLAGCQTPSRETPQRRLSPPRPEPTVMKVLRDVRPNRMTLVVGPKADDIEGDGAPDLISVAVVLFDEPRPEPVITSGTFFFEATPIAATTAANSAAEPMGWSFSPEEVRKAEAPTMFGLPGYRFQLNISEGGGSAPPSGVYNISGRFQPQDGGSPVVCRPDQRLVRLGGR